MREKDIKGQVIIGLIMVAVIGIISLFANKCNAQIKEVPTIAETILGTVKDGASIRAEIRYIIKNNDTLYSLLYSNAEYKVINDYHIIKFWGNETLSQFYNFCQKVLTDNLEKEILIGTNKISLIPKGKNISFITKDGYFFVSKNQLDKLFARGHNGDKKQ